MIDNPRRWFTSRLVLAPELTALEVTPHIWAFVPYAAILTDNYPTYQWGLLGDAIVTKVSISFRDTRSEPLRF